jgi:hypothetical protein
LSPFFLMLALAAAQLPPLDIHTPGDSMCDGKVRARLALVSLTRETTQASVIAAWGAGYPDGAAGEMLTYYADCDARFWLSFEEAPPHRLTRALLLSGSFVPHTTMLFNRLEVTRRRRCDQVRRGRGQDGRRIAAAWGPPDNQVGSGLVRWTYDMANGGFAQVFPEGKGRFLVTCSRPARRR